MHPDKLERLESILWRFEDAWRTPVPPDPEDFLLDIADTDRAELLQELIAIDLEHRVRRQPNATSDRYLQKYPELFSSTMSRNELVRRELRLRNKFGQYPTESEFRSRFANDSSLHAIRSTMADDSDSHAPVGDSIECGTRIGAYVVEERIGGGAFADVYRAKDSQLNRMAALKFLKTWTREAEHLRARMLREAQAVATLQHPHVVPVFETGSVDGHDYIASRYIDGPTLKEWAQVNSPGFRQSAAVVASLASALDAAHSNGIIHRDVKPDNVMMQDDSPMLVDFGLAHFGAASVALTHEGDIVGTPAYMSPEQASGVREVGPASDIYSLGVVLYQLITRKLPFEGSTPALLHSTLHEEPIPPRRIITSIPVDLQTICQKSLSKSPSDRYPTAQQMADDLWRFFRGEPVTARPIGLAEKSARLVRKYPIASTLAVLLLVSLGVGVGVAVQYQGVVKQRNRATVAEATSKSLLARDAAVSGLLAQRRGQTQIAVSRYREAIARGCDDESDIQISIAECELVNGNFTNVLESLERAKSLGIAEAAEPRVQLIQIQLVLEGVNQSKTVDTIALLEEIDPTRLSEPNRYFLAGLNASTSPDAYSNFVRAYDLDPHHYAARRMAAIVAFTLAEFEQAIAICETAEQIFPQDDSFSLVLLLAHSAQGSTDQKAKILATRSVRKERAEWQAASDFVSRICQKYDTGGLRVFKDDRADESELTLAQMNSLIDEFTNDHLELFRRNHWFLPPRVEAAFARFRVIAARQVAQQNSLFGNLTSTFSGAGKELLDAGTALVAAHPEGSLSTTIAKEVLDKAGSTLDTTIRVQQFYNKAVDSKSFLSGTRRHALIGAYLTALSLSRRHQHHSESNNQRANEVIAMIEPESINDASLLRALSLSPLQVTPDWETAGRFIPHWVKVAKEAGDESMIVDALWHHTLYLRNQNNWYFVLTTCNEILECISDKKSSRHVQTQGLRDQAMSKLAQAVDVGNSPFAWQAVLVTSLIEEDWNLAKSAIERLRRQTPLTDELIKNLEAYESIQLEFQAGEFRKAAAVLRQMPPQELNTAWVRRLQEYIEARTSEDQPPANE